MFLWFTFYDKHVTNLGMHEIDVNIFYHYFAYFHMKYLTKSLECILVFRNNLYPHSKLNINACIYKLCSFKCNVVV